MHLFTWLSILTFLVLTSVQSDSTTIINEPSTISSIRTVDHTTSEIFKETTTTTTVDHTATSTTLDRTTSEIFKETTTTTTVDHTASEIFTETNAIITTPETTTTSTIEGLSTSDDVSTETTTIITIPETTTTTTTTTSTTEELSSSDDAPTETTTTFTAAPENTTTTTTTTSTTVELSTSDDASTETTTTFKTTTTTKITTKPIQTINEEKIWNLFSCKKTEEIDECKYIEIMVYVVLASIILFIILFATIIYLCCKLKSDSSDEESIPDDIPSKVDDDDASVDTFDFPMQPLNMTKKDPAIERWQEHINRSLNFNPIIDDAQNNSKKSKTGQAEPVVPKTNSKNPSTDMITPKRSNKKIEAQSNYMNLEDETEQQPRRSTKKVINEAQSNNMNLDDDDEDVTKNKKRSTRKIQANESKINEARENYMNNDEEIEDSSFRASRKIVKTIDNRDRPKVAAITQIVHQTSKKAPPQVLPRTIHSDIQSIDDIDEQKVKQTKSTKMIAPKPKQQQNVVEPRTSNNSNRFKKNKIQYKNKSVSDDDDDDDDDTLNDAAF